MKFFFKKTMEEGGDVEVPKVTQKIISAIRLILWAAFRSGGMKMEATMQTQLSTCNGTLPCGRLYTRTDCPSYPKYPKMRWNGMGVGLPYESPEISSIGTPPIPLQTT